MQLPERSSAALCAQLHDDDMMLLGSRSLVDRLYEISKADSRAFAHILQNLASIGGWECIHDKVI